MFKRGEKHMKTIKFDDFLAKNYEKSDKSEQKVQFFKNFLIITAILLFGGDIIYTVVVALSNMLMRM
jgi:accessory gene regulator protein AgrB